MQINFPFPLSEKYLNKKATNNGKDNKIPMIAILFSFCCSAAAGHGVGLCPGADRVAVYNGNDIISNNKKLNGNGKMETA